MNKQLLNLINNFFFYVNNSEGKGKIVIGTNLPGIHYTIYTKSWSGYYDIHRTDQYNKKHFTLFKIKKTDADKIIERLLLATPILIEQYLLSTIIELTELEQRNYCILPISTSIKEEDVILRVSPKKFKLKSNLFQKKYAKKFILIKNISRSRANSFMVYSSKYRFYGTLIKLPLKGKNNKLCYIKRTNINKFIENYKTVILFSIKELNIENKIKIRNSVLRFFKDIKL